MVTQLHLALILAIDAQLLVLDEPTLGLDLLYRRQFYDTLLNDYFDKERTILLTTHQVEEIEHLLTDVLFIEQGRIVLDSPVDSLAERFVQLIVGARPARRARAPCGRSTSARSSAATRSSSKACPRESLAALGDVAHPVIADLFVRKDAGRP